MILSKGQTEYSTAREAGVWNGLVPARYPQVIARPRSSTEVQQLVRRAATDRHRISIRSGGHDYHGACLRDGGMLIDLGSLNAVNVEAGKGEAWAGPGSTNLMLVRSAHSRGFAFPTGHSSSVGLGGYILGGGLGWNPTEWGPACWSVSAIRAVTVDGDLIEADCEHHDDLFWAARGGAAGFPAVVTGFKLRLQPLPCVMSCRLVYPLDALPFLLTWARDIETPGLEISVVARRSEPIFQDGRASARIALTGFGSTVDRARSLVHSAISEAFAPENMLDSSEPVDVPFKELEAEGSWITGLRYGVDGGWIDHDLERIGGICENALKHSPSKLSRIVFARGQYPAPAPDVAFTVLGSMTAHVYGTWEHEKDDRANHTWVRDLISEIGPGFTGFWAAQSNLQAAPGRARASFSPEKWDRLSRIREHYDPERRKHSFLE